jgi:hypothetical protein
MFRKKVYAPDPPTGIGAATEPPPMTGRPKHHYVDDPCLGGHRARWETTQTTPLSEEWTRAPAPPKARLDLLPHKALLEMARAMEEGAEKYGANDWMRKPHRASEDYAAALRHLMAWWTGTDKDPKSGVSPLAHALCRAAMLLETMERFPEKDDRPK